ncbi:MAG: serine/threonine protein kinase [Planctomycetes bacterium]|jgi:hypothetical protein|nr:serine/threonine protein kinase [Planctomycetota bacterium]HPY75195.1 hypothetical protein [Planctomycetota bacterium]HQB00864.1 hypothetical protein [Planctomycetota bacterium]
MIKIRGILKTKNINTPVEYRVIESDKKILRVTDTETQSWYDLRPILEDTVAFENISKEVKNKEHLTNRHGYGIVASHGIFSYEDCDFLVTDAFGGKSLDTFLNTFSIENKPKISHNNVLLFMEEITETLSDWKNFHGYVNGNTILLDQTVSHNMFKSGLICFPERFPMEEMESFPDYFQPSIYLKKLGNQQLIADDQYALAIAILQFICLDIGLTEPVFSNEVILQFQHYLNDLPISRFFQTKILSYIKKLIDGAVTFEEVLNFVQCTNWELESAKQLGEHLHKYLQQSPIILPKLTRTTYYLQFRCPYCQSVTFEQRQSTGIGTCPICFQNITFVRKPEQKICRTCKTEFPVENELCPECTPYSDVFPEKNQETMKVYEPLEIFEGSEEIVNPLTILEGFDNSGSVEINDPIDMIDEDPQSIYNKTMVRPKIDRKQYRTFASFGEEEKTIPVTAKPGSFHISALHQNGKLTVEIVKAIAGRWNFEVANEEKGESLVEGEYVCTETKNIKYVIPLNDDELGTYIFLRVYLESKLMGTKKIIADNQNKTLLGKIWKK